MSALSPLDATRHYSLVREHADDIHNINFTVAQALQSASRLRSALAAWLQEKDRVWVDRIMTQNERTFDKFQRKYQPSTPGKEERRLSHADTYWVFFALSGSDFDKSVEMAEDMTKSLRELEEVVAFLKETQSKRSGVVAAGFI